MNLLDAAFAGIDDADLMESGVYGDFGDLDGWKEWRQKRRAKRRRGKRARLGRRRGRKLRRLSRKGRGGAKGQQQRRRKAGKRWNMLFRIYLASRKARGLPSLSKMQKQQVKKMLKRSIRFAKKRGMTPGKTFLSTLGRVLGPSDTDGAALRQRRAGAILSAMWSIAGKKKGGLRVMRSAFPKSRPRGIQSRPARSGAFGPQIRTLDYGPLLKRRALLQQQAASEIDETSAEDDAISEGSFEFEDQELPEDIEQEDIAEDEGAFDEDDESFDEDDEAIVDDMEGIIPEALDRYLPQSQNGQLALIAALGAASLMSHKIAKKKKARELIRVGAGAGALLLAWEMWSERGAAASPMTVIDKEDAAEAAGFGFYGGW